MREHTDHPISSANAHAGRSASPYQDSSDVGGNQELWSQLPEVDTDLLEAFLSAVDAADLERVVTTVREGWFDLVRADQQMVRGALDRLGSGVVRNSPLLAMLAGMTYYRVPHLRIRALRLFLIATRVAGSEKRSVDAVDRVLILTSASVAHRLIGRSDRGVSAARRATEILRGMTEDQRDRVPMLSRLYAQLGTTMYYGGQPADALDAFEHGLAAVPPGGYSHGFMNLSMLAGIHAQRGDLSETEAYLDLARGGPWTDLVRAAYPGTFYRLAEAIVALERFDVAEARNHLAAMVHDRRTIEHWIPIAITEAMTQLAGGRPGAALAGLNAFAALRRGEGRTASARAELAPIRALLHSALGNPDEALRVLRHDAAPGPETSIGLARVELALDRHGAALQHLRCAAGHPMSQRHAAEKAAVEAAVLLRFSSQARVAGAVDHLGATLALTGQRLPAMLVPDVSFQQMRSALAEAGYGTVVAEFPVRSFFPDVGSAPVLTERERAVLRELLHTPSTAAIAAELVVSVNTVKTQLRSLYRKLGVSSRDEAIAVALDRHLVADPIL